MNKENYKQIAKIINRTNYLQKVKVNIVLIDRLADYFEREDKDSIKDYAYDFNKKQFLKQCGVE